MMLMRGQLAVSACLGMIGIVLFLMAGSYAFNWIEQLIVASLGFFSIIGGFVYGIK